MSDLERVTAELYDAYEQSKHWKTRLDGQDKKKKNRETGIKEEFFDIAAEEVAKATLARKTIMVEARTLEEAEVEAKRRNPRWLVVSGVAKFQDTTPPTHWKILLEENPFYKEFTYVNQTLGKVFTRQVVDGSASLDDEKLRQEDVELWKRVTEIDNIDFIRGALGESGITEHEDLDEFIARMESNYEAARTLRPLESLAPDDLSALQKYIYPGAPTVKLAQPRDVKPEDLNEDDDES